MKKLILFVCALFIAGCSKSVDYKYSDGFPEKTLTYGNNADSTFRSIQTVRQGDGTLKVLLTGWQVVEYGIFFNAVRNQKSLIVNLMGECGTVPSKTTKKLTLGYEINRSDEDSLNSIIYPCGVTELKIIR